MRRTREVEAEVARSRREIDGEQWDPVNLAHAARDEDVGWRLPTRMLTSAGDPPRFPRLERFIAVVVPAYAVRRARARRALDAERIAAEVASRARAPRPHGHRSSRKST